MNSKTQAPPDTVIFVPSALTVSQTIEWRPELAKRIQEAPTAHLDFSKNQEADTIGVQLVIAAAKSANAAGKVLALANLSDAFRNACESIGIDTLSLNTIVRN